LAFATPFPGFSGVFPHYMKYPPHRTCQVFLVIQSPLPFHCPFCFPKWSVLFPRGKKIFSSIYIGGRSNSCFSILFFRTIFVPIFLLVFPFSLFPSPSALLCRYRPFMIVCGVRVFCCYKTFFEPCFEFLWQLLFLFFLPCMGTCWAEGTRRYLPWGPLCTSRARVLALLLPVH